MRSFVLAYILFASCLPVAAEWTTLEGCRLIPHPFNDGDSFHVRHGDREYLFRLCYVDCPETEDMKEFRERTAEQAKYWRLPTRDVFFVGELAREFTLAALANGFTVRTNWKDARGQSRKNRYFAVIKTPEGDLAELLVAAGLARVYGYMPTHPVTRKSGPDTMNRLRAIEREARAKKRGAWSGSKALQALRESCPVKPDVPEQPLRSRDSRPYVPAI
jgi:endonuclease YncB( thermonuclease family)